MKREIKLTNKNGNYGTIGERNVFRKHLCGSFVHGLIGQIPQDITVEVSDNPSPTGFEVQVSRLGYYRWNWRHRQFWSGMYPAAEEIAAKFFPDMSTNGADAGSLWINIH
jgi:hypothetical protein